MGNEQMCGIEGAFRLDIKAVSFSFPIQDGHGAPLCHEISEEKADIHARTADYLVTE
jgi:hypothetical protein